jgi:hypothetical protein
MDTPRRRSWFTFSLRTVGIVLTVLLVVLGYWANRSLRQRAAVESILRRGGRINYVTEDLSKVAVGAPTAEPHWLAKYLGRDFIEGVGVAEFIGKDFTDADLKLLDDLPDVHWFRIYETQITGSEFAHVSRLKKLRSLLVHHSPLGDDAMIEVGKLHDLELLYLQDTRITDRGAVRVSGLDKLTRLTMSRCAITDAALAEGLSPDITELSLEDTGITDAGLVPIGRLQHLERLSLVGSKVTDDGVAALQSMKSLKAVMLGDTVSQQGLLKLQERRPDLYVSPSPTGER